MNDYNNMRIVREDREGKIVPVEINPCKYWLRIKRESYAPSSIACEMKSKNFM